MQAIEHTHPNAMMKHGMDALLLVDKLPPCEPRRKFRNARVCDDGNLGVERGPWFSRENCLLEAADCSKTTSREAVFQYTVYIYIFPRGMYFGLLSLSNAVYSTLYF